MARERAIANQLARLLGASNLPIYAVDDRRHIVYCNAACADWVGAEVEELIGQRCDYDSANSGDRLADLAARLCPPPEAFLGQLPAAHITIAGGPQETSARTAACITLTGATNESVGVLVVVKQANEDPNAGNRTGDNSDGSELLHRRLRALTNKLRLPYRLGRLVGESLVMQFVREQVRIAIETPANVQIVGQPGSGREHIGRTIHAGDQPDQAGPLMPLDCNLLDGELLQATVVAFLHRATEASASHPATLLLLDCDQLNAEAQAELLAFFRVPTFRLRTIATCQRPLIQSAAEGTFLRELAYRLCAMTIELPSLSERREDIPLLCQRTLEEFNGRGEKQLSGFAPGVLDQLCSLPWKGDVGELEEVVLQMCEQADGPKVTEADVARRVKLVTSAMKHPAPEAESIQLDEFLVEVETELLRRALRAAKGNKAEAARLLGISRARVIRRAAHLGLE
ncbi:MAG: sigma 54-interacting transcriptional regulator [Planctomycetaceae bacterium]|nr:sigma 54-interacting transcriptional regulator [Planctomycetales bacterium]MCB9875235.1 sigma 54-interacting transcriptional regulator [Planctomycetaceae bacterium]MCB9938869.1 sigma 54-interacting transcriptional regulator [Planctomycetaceae bacterium]